MAINEDTIKTTKTKTTKPKSLNDVIAEKNEKLKTDEKTSLASRLKKSRTGNRFSQNTRKKGTEDNNAKDGI